MPASSVCRAPTLPTTAPLPARSPGSNDILVQYPKEGRYEFVQEGLSHLQFFGMGPPNVTLAYVDVTAAPPDFPGPIDLEGELLPKLEAVAPYQGWGGKGAAPTSHGGNEPGPLAPSFPVTLVR